MRTMKWMTRKKVIEQVYEMLWAEFAKLDNKLNSEIMPLVLETLRSKIGDRKSRAIRKRAINTAWEGELNKEVSREANQR